MRFDDSLDTVLAADMATPFGAQSAWRQLTDLIGRGRVAASPAAMAALAKIRPMVPPTIRAASARSLAFADPPAGLVRLFGDDMPMIAAPVLSVARLQPAEWLALIPDLPPSSRALLRHRRDLGAAVARALDSFGRSDFVLPGPPAEKVGEDRPADRVSALSDREDLPAPYEVVRPPDGGQPAINVADGDFITLMNAAMSVPVIAEAARRGEADPANDDEGATTTAFPVGERAVPGDTETAGGPFPIADLVARIDAYQRSRPTFIPLEPPVAAALPTNQFRFETDAQGVIRWVEGAPRELLIGMPLDGAGAGAPIRGDGIVLGSFRRRAVIADARLEIATGPALSGSWQVSASPAFDRATGRFTGYRGVARRPRVDERAEPIARAAMPGAESLRQLVHELRTPTNAITGFAEMIESEILGSAPLVYRQRAGAIRDETRDLLEAIDDLDLAARIEQRVLALRPALVPVAPLLTRIGASLEPLMRERGCSVTIERGPPGLTITGDAMAVERIISRLMATMVGATGAGERVAVHASLDPAGAVSLGFDRPAALAAYSIDGLLAIDAEDHDLGARASLLGAGFALRLARNLAGELGGALVVDQHRLTLRLPAVLDHPVEQLFSH
ncbi:sensor histidine kinase [uncultured Sphingomonas sp.]|uniref:sensor histidine kinase n=1 Tax=uncultured Sphingomonas sp. TaxID=158754 RepID=UPI0035CB69D9